MPGLLWKSVCGHRYVWGIQTQVSGELQSHGISYYTTHTQRLCQVKPSPSLIAMDAVTRVADDRTNLATRGDSCTVTILHVTDKKLGLQNQSVATVKAKFKWTRFCWKTQGQDSKQMVFFGTHVVVLAIFALRRPRRDAHAGLHQAGLILSCSISLNE